MLAPRFPISAVHSMGRCKHHLGTNLFKGGVYDPTKTVETFSRGKDRHLAPMEVWAVPARDWARLWQAVSKLLLPCGGIAPAPRRRSRLALTLAEREDIRPSEPAALTRSFGSNRRRESP